MEIHKNKAQEIIFGMISDSIEHALVKWKSPDQVEVVELASEKHWFEADAVLLRDYCRPLEVKRLTSHYDSISSIPSEISFSIKTNQDSYLIYSISRIVEEERYSLWLRMPSICRPIQYLQDAAHDMKSPINAIIGVANIMQHEVDEDLDMAQVKTYLDLIKKSAYSSVDLLNEVMELAEMESANYEITTEKVDMVDFVDYYLKTHRLLTLKKKIKVHYEASGACKTRIDKSRMTRVLDNVISNAVKFSEHGSNIYVTVGEQNELVTISIKDEGIGIPDKIKNELFIKFGKAKRKGLDGEQSNGLGMSIIKQIVDLHHGELQVLSEEGKGTEIILSLKKSTE